MNIGTKLKKNLRSLVWFIRRYHMDISAYKTSVSDNDEYPDYVRSIISNDELFNNFKVNYIYNKTVNYHYHDEWIMGNKYIDIIKNNSIELLNHIDEFRKDDAIGGDFVYDWGGQIKKVSLNTLYYIADMSIMDRLFKLKGIHKVCEVGIGYGGLCRLLMSYTKNMEYTLVDLPIVLELGEKYLSQFDRDNLGHGHYIKKTVEEIKPDESYDLFISINAFSELKKDLQNIYLDKLILKSKCGYIVDNGLAGRMFGSDSKNKLVKMIPNSHIIKNTEIGYSDDSVALIYWDNRN